MTTVFANQTSGMMDHDVFVVMTIAISKQVNNALSSLFKRASCTVSRFSIVVETKIDSCKSQDENNK